MALESAQGSVGEGLLALGDRAYGFVVARGPVSEAALLTHVYGGPPPPALMARLAAPLLDDPRLERRADGSWSAIGGQPPEAPSRLGELELTTLAIAATGPNPDRGRVVRLCALRVRNGTALERFEVTVHPGKRVPRYVAERLALAPEALDELPPFAAILDDLVAFLGARPVLAQDARLTWSFVRAEARRAGRVLAEPPLVDANGLATRWLNLQSKPTLALVAAHLGIGTLSLTRPDEEARVLGQLVAHLVASADRAGLRSLEALLQLTAEQASAPDERGRRQTAPLRRGQTARAQPDAPGVYVLRDAEQAALYVGKARRLRSRVSAYVHRPLGTRRLEGLVGSVEGVDSTVCATDLEALVLEDREIRRLQPRFNTVRQQRTPRLWIRLPPLPTPRSGKRQPAPRRLEPSLGPTSADGEFVGPFRNQTLAEHLRRLARAVFELDTLRHADLQFYEERLGLAWHFLRFGGQSEAAVDQARQRSTRLLHAVLACDPAALRLPVDPRAATYVVVRPGPAGIEGFRLERGIFQGWSVLTPDGDARQFAAALLAPAEPRTALEDADVVLRWFGAQRPPARLIHVAQDSLVAADAIEAAASDLADRLLLT
ncbi:MAG TPA: hypothetical protein VKV73_00985 [Chloroflexota bacterium]|nr:hypothetical protein [Chloroflexota bacterium]